MPLRRANSVIVYLDSDVFNEVVRQAEALERSRSWVCQDLIKEALAWRKGTHSPNRDASSDAP